MISLTAPTRVVLPAPKPPATMIFTDVGITVAAHPELECTDTFKHRLK
jgi:hypothetical protein